MTPPKPATKKGSAKKQRKKQPLISTDAAVVSSTFFASFLTLISNPLLLREMLSQLFSPANREALDTMANQIYGKSVPSQDAIEQAAETLKPAHEAMNSIFDKVVTSSCDQAAHLLASVLFLEKIYKRIDLKDPRDVVKIIYCAIRLAQDQQKFDKIKQAAINDSGKHWLWPLVWAIALMNESVKKRWDSEEANGRLDLLDWMDDCQKFANNYWTSRQAEYENIKAQKAKMILSLRKTLGLSDIETPPNV